ncbi:lipid-A-disaccharide synthase [Marinihelvus fidelis]|uniref:Lipid-A-disaccharide synthase n=1 Tax=Marinihelvus fidelis TaxID=2613842 RepID=A0A5N0T8G9_9GAMM|nr:lipid-A-disaccharide synthase [Marinihelvus fidelis]KAA9129599.1 lipid-A-disaccharide synthase [Marinihelvus fidelis]
MPTAPSSASPRIALIAGEASGDQLGGALIRALRQRYPDAEIFGIGGDHMRAAGFDTWWDRRELSVMGLAEVLRHLPRLLKLRGELLRRLDDARPDILVGIDAPDFNLGVERRAREAGMTTVQYVSPTVWAWRQGRVKGIARAVDRVLCLFPFEPAFYERHGVTARYTGHPMADAIPLHNDPVAARQSLGLETEGEIVALLPGSRASEVSRLAGPYIEAAVELASRRPGIRFVAPMADEGARACFESVRETMNSAAKAVDIQLVDGRALEVMAAADVVLVASGTAALECMLVNRPMVVSYRLAPATYRILRHFRLMKTAHVSLPNILAGEALVPELFQHDVTGPALADAAEAWLDGPDRRAALTARFDALHRELRIDAAASAAAAIAELLDQPAAA